MAQQYWFKANKSGYGWHPVNLKGWGVLFIYLLFLLHSFWQVHLQSHSTQATFIAFLPRWLLFTAILTVITYLKGESITWGEKDKNQ